VIIQKRIRGRTSQAIAASIEDELRGGGLDPGSALPTVRELGASLKVSPATVAAAYRILRGRGLTIGSGRGGTRISPRPPLPAPRRVSPSAPGLVDLASGNPDPALLPPLEPALRSLTTEPRLYGDAGELRPLMRFLAADFDADGVSARSLALVNGALDGVERVLREHLRPGDLVAIEDPVYPGLLDLLAAAGYRHAPVAVDDDGPVPEALAAALAGARAAIVTPRAQNPTGAAITADRARELRRVLGRRREVLLIENDAAGPVAGASYVPIADAAAPAWVTIRSTSKFLGPDLRFAAIAGDARTIARVEGRQALGARWVSTILQQLVLGLWSDPAGGRQLARAAAVYAQRRVALIAALRARGMAAHGRSGFNVWIPVRDEAVIVGGLADNGWAVMAGERFRIRTAPAIRVTTSPLQPEDAVRFAAALASLAPMDSRRAAAC
jgi:DNA-binding transcriptional MocR family regulator